MGWLRRLFGAQDEKETGLHLTPEEEGGIKVIRIPKINKGASFEYVHSILGDPDRVESMVEGLPAGAYSYEVLSRWQGRMSWVYELPSGQVIFAFDETKRVAGVGFDNKEGWKTQWKDE